METVLEYLLMENKKLSIDFWNFHIFIKIIFR